MAGKLGDYEVALRHVSSVASLYFEDDLFCVTSNLDINSYMLHNLLIYLFMYLFISLFIYLIVIVILHLIPLTAQ